ncbi:MAG TPA: hypothetical protein DCZ94_02990 [Lentisphaeria bacterium]|nr:MAG: hypothetical protein A2X48_15815 [Lentisphaerae bacterium GWF2_49_21]HBC85900.1 hypothetical protein [Lentisphaeria bacterium]
MKKNKILLFGILSPVMVIALVFAVSLGWQAMCKCSILNEQARWVARYIGSEDFDFNATKAALGKSRPYKYLDLNIWYPVVSNMKDATRTDIIIGCSENAWGKYPAILRDQSIVWVNKPPGEFVLPISAPVSDRP